MIKSELIERLAADLTDISEKNITNMVNGLLVILSGTIASNKRIEIRGFGSFCLHHRPARKARNPKTMKEIETDDKFLPHFKPGKELKERIMQSKKPIKN